MQLLRLARYVLLLAVLSLSLVYFTNYVLAVELNPTPTISKAPSYSENIRQRAKERAEEQKQDRASKAAEIKENWRVKACQTKEKVVRQQFRHLTDLVDNMFRHFDRTAERVQEYYKNKVVPTGKTAPNYDALLTDVKAKKEAVNKALTAAKTNAQDFDCNTENPREQLNQFHKDMQVVKQALYDYRKSIKNLTQAVHKVAQDNEEKATKAPKPTKEVRQ